MMGKDIVQIGSQANNFFGLDVNVGGLSLKSAHGLMDHDPTVGQSVAHTGFSGGQEQRAHAGGLPHAQRGNRCGDILHGIINSHTGGDRPTRRVDIQVDLLLRIVRFQKQQLGTDQVGHVIVYGRTQQDDPVSKQTGIDIVCPLRTTGRLNDHGDIHAHSPW